MRVSFVIISSDFDAPKLTDSAMTLKNAKRKFLFSWPHTMQAAPFKIQQFAPLNWQAGKWWFRVGCVLDFQRKKKLKQDFYLRLPPWLGVAKCLNGERSVTFSPTHIKVKTNSQIIINYYYKMAEQASQWIHLRKYWSLNAFKRTWIPGWWIAFEFYLHTVHQVEGEKCLVIC